MLVPALRFAGRRSVAEDYLAIQGAQGLPQVILSLELRTPAQEHADTGAHQVHVVGQWGQKSSRVPRRRWRGGRRVKFQWTTRPLSLSMLTAPASASRSRRSFPSSSRRHSSTRRSRLSRLTREGGGEHVNLFNSSKKTEVFLTLTVRGGRRVLGG